MTSYHALETRFAEITRLENAQEILTWDTLTMMPVGGLTERGEQLSLLKTLEHRLLIDPQVGEWLELADSETLSDWQRSNLSEMRHRYFRERVIPENLLAQATRANTQAEGIWKQAREENEFSLLASSLKQVLALQREIGDCLADSLGLSRYDALLDGYERGLCQAFIDPLFESLGEFLPSLLEKVKREERNSSSPASCSLQEQERLARDICERIGFNFTNGRLDTSAHPFCAGARQDTRITTRYDETNVLSGLMGVIHETGHALYEQGLPLEWSSQPVGRSRGMMIHESQSLVIEKQAGHSAEFISYLSRRLSEYGYSGMDLEKAVVRVDPGYIRVEADEVTYPLHILLRYELEKDLIMDDLTIDDLPEAWNEGMEELLGIRPPDDRLGCLQDPHWAGGAWGYFPTYLLGAMTAAQLFQAARDQDQTILPSLTQGDFTPLRTWLRSNIHAYASRYDAQTLIEKASGSPLTLQPFKDHLIRRYDHV